MYNCSHEDNILVWVQSSRCKVSLLWCLLNESKYTPATHINKKIIIMLMTLIIIATMIWIIMIVKLLLIQLEHIHLMILLLSLVSAVHIYAGIVSRIILPQLKRAEIENLAHLPTPRLSSVTGWASHRYGKSYGFKFCWSLIPIQANFQVNCFNCDDYHSLNAPLP